MGLSIARVFGRSGARVQLVARDRTGAEAMVSTLADEAISAVGVAGNVGDPQSLRAALAEARDASGDPDVVIYNAGGNLQGPIEDLGFDDFMATYALGVAGALVTLQSVLPAMRAAGSGTFIATGSGASVRPYATGSAVGAPKAALRNFIQAASMELAPAGIRVATVTIHGVLGSGPAFEPAALAERFWTVWTQSALPRDEWDWELNVRA
jgi:NAD(P)-dependent dehydrogenase (short-subunit alcohol dehydrogenase family)